MKLPIMHQIHSNNVVEYFPQKGLLNCSNIFFLWYNVCLSNLRSLSYSVSSESCCLNLTLLFSKWAFLSNSVWVNFLTAQYAFIFSILICISVSVSSEIFFPIISSFFKPFFSLAFYFFRPFSFMWIFVWWHNTLCVINSGVKLN